MKERELVFVYGTLRKGASNHFRMEGAEFVGAGTVRGHLYRIDWYPGLVLDPDGGDVQGEVYRVSAEALRELDEFEGPEYRRERATVTGPGLTVWIWEYSAAVKAERLIAGGDWMTL